MFATINFDRNAQNAIEGRTLKTIVKIVKYERVLAHKEKLYCRN